MDLVACGSELFISDCLCAPLFLPPKFRTRPRTKQPMVVPMTFLITKLRPIPTITSKTKIAILLIVFTLQNNSHQIVPHAACWVPQFIQKRFPGINGAPQFTQYLFCFRGLSRGCTRAGWAVGTDEAWGRARVVSHLPQNLHLGTSDGIMAPQNGQFIPLKPSGSLINSWSPHLMVYAGESSQLQIVLRIVFR